MRALVTGPVNGEERAWVVVAPTGTTSRAVGQEIGTVWGTDDLLRNGHAFQAEGDGVQNHDPRPSALIGVVTGPSAARWSLLRPAAPMSVGRHPGADLVVDDPTVSRRHLELAVATDGVKITPLTLTNVSPTPPHSVRSGARVVVGSGQIAFPRALAPASSRACPGGWTVSPWPRQEPHLSTADLTIPPPPIRRAARSPSPWSWALPLVASSLMALALRMPVLLIFALLGPAMALGQHLGDRRTARIEHDEALHQHREATAEVRATAARLALEEERLRHERDPGIEGVLAAVVPKPSTSLWCRASEELRVVVGTEAGMPSAVSFEGEQLLLERPPSVVALDRPLALVGPPPLTTALAHTILLQLATAYPPGRISLEVDRSAAPEPPDILVWLPHTRQPCSSPPGAQTLRWGQELVTVEDEVEAPSGSVRVLVHDRLSATLRIPGEADRTVQPILVGREDGHRLARALSCLRDHATLTTATPVTLGDAGRWPASVHEVQSGWGRAGGQSTPLARGADGVHELDLVQDGPHALIGGTTGSGKSELLRTLVLGLAVGSPPEGLSLLLVDFKGGATFSDLSALPHVVGIVDDLAQGLAERVLTSLRAEITRREHVLANAGARDVADLPPERRPPRLVVVIDEFRVLVEEVPDALCHLTRLAAVGRSLGLHLVLATQRPGGVVPADLRANINLRVALRVRDAVDSRDLIDTPDAAELPEGSPGAALIQSGSGSATLVQVLRPGPASREPDGIQAVPVADLWDGWGLLQDDAPAVDASSVSALVDLLAEAGRGRESPPVWLPPLEERITAPDPRTWAVADDVTGQTRRSVRWDARTSIAIAGSPGSGRSTALRSLLAAAPPSWITLLDLGGTLADLGSAGAVRTLVGPDDARLCARALELLDEELRRRRAAGAIAPRLILAVDGWDRLEALLGEHERGYHLDLARVLLRDGPSVGLVSIVTGDRSTLTGAVARAVPETWVLRLNDPGDVALTGLRALPVPQPPGRLVRVEDGMVAQTTVPGMPSPPPPGQAPPRIVALPASWPGRPGAVGLGGDDAEPVQPPSGDVLILGPPGAGRSTALAVLRAARPELRPVDPADPQLAAALENCRATGHTAAVDDVHLLLGTAAEDLLLSHLGRGGSLVAAGDLEHLGSSYRGLAPRLARTASGIVLNPSRPDHGSLWHVRVPVGDHRIPGRGVLIERGKAVRLQLAADPAAVRTPDGP